MKKLLLPILFMLTSHAFSQSCGAEGVKYIINNQQKADSFAEKFKGCTEFLGDIIIIGETENLKGLSSLKRIKGTLQIWNTPSLKSIEGLNNLEFVGGDLSIGLNQQIVELNPLSNLKEVGKKLTINKNEKLQNIDGLKSLKVVGDALMINLNPELTNLEGLNNLESIGGILYVFTNIKLNNLMTSNRLKKVSEKIVFTANASLKNLTGLDNVDVASVNAININNNTSLTTCNSKMICNYITTGKPISFVNNGAGCNNINEVKTTCK